MKRHRRWYVIPVIFALIALPLFLSLRFYIVNFSWFSAAGTIAHKEHSLMITAVLLMLLVILPVFGLLFAFAWRYRARNTKAVYLPDWDHAKTDELIWWAIPCEIILVLASITWSSTHELDPWKPLESNVPPITIEVVSLDWKWLFIYPDEGIATVNELEIPVNTPIAFKLTSDAPMNSFWIPRLGGQIMTMTGMVTQIHLIATQEGTFQGRSANFSGDGFSGMQFDVRSVSNDTFKAWAASIKSSGAPLDEAAYAALAKQSENEPPRGYMLPSTQLFDAIVHKYMKPMQTQEEMNAPVPVTMNMPQESTSSGTTTSREGAQATTTGSSTQPVMDTNSTTSTSTTQHM